MSSNVSSVGALLRRCAFLFLALSVFWFGLHARIEAFTTGASNLTASKLATEEHSAKVLKALEREDVGDTDIHAFLLELLVQSLRPQAVRLPLSELAKIELADPRRLDLDGTYTLHGPPADVQ